MSKVLAAWDLNERSQVFKITENTLSARGSSGLATDCILQLV